MRVTIDLPDKDLEPLIQAHLNDDTFNVADKILTAVQCYNKAVAAMEKHDNICLATVTSRGRYGNVAIHEVLLPAKKGED